MPDLVYIADDEPNIRKLAALALKDSGFETQEFADGVSLMAAVRVRKSDAIVLDWMMPRPDGLADDYITKPFSVKELCARVRAVIRRKEYLSPVQDEVLTCGPISVNTAARRCLKNGEPVELTMKEFDLLVMLMRNAGRVLTRDALLDKVWGLEYFGDARTVDVHIRYLRQKIEDEPDNPRLVVTLRGVGYRFASAEDLK